MMFSNQIVSCDLTQYVSQSQTEDFREDRDTIGLMWEVPLEKNSPHAEKLREMGIWSMGLTSDRKVTVMVLPMTATKEETLQFTLALSLMLSNTAYEEVITDYSTKNVVDKYRMKIIRELAVRNWLEPLRAWLNPEIYPHSIAKRILKDQESKEKFIALGEKIYRRIEGNIDDYSVNILECMGIVVKRHPLKEALGGKTPSDLTCDKEKVEFYLELVSSLKLYYNEKYGIASLEGGNLKECAYQSICMIAATAFERQARRALISAALTEDPKLVEATKFMLQIIDKIGEIGDPSSKTVAEVAEIVGCSTAEFLYFTPSMTPESCFNDFLEAHQKQVNKIIDQHIHAEYEIESEKELEKVTLFPEKEVQMLSLLEESDNEKKLANLLGDMHRMVTEEGVEGLFAEEKAYKGAWREGDVGGVKQHAGAIAQYERMTYSESEEVAKKIVENVRKNRSSLFILPVGFVAGFSLPRYFNSQNMRITRIVKEMPKEQMARGIFFKIISKEGEVVGHLLGTLHAANEKVMRLNPTIVRAIDKASTIYFEIDPAKAEVRQPNSSISSLAYLDEKQQTQLAKSFKLLFPKLILKLRAEGVESQKINALEVKFKFCNLKGQADLVFGLLSMIRAHKAGIVHVLDVFANKPAGIDHMLMQYASIHGIKTQGLEEDSEERVQLVEQMVNKHLSEFLSKPPTTADEIDSFLAESESELVRYCEAWINGDETFFSKAGDYFDNMRYQVLTKRDIVMADGIHAALSNRVGQETLFFAVGSLHLVGSESNVITKIREKGWQIERV